MFFSLHKFLIWKVTSDYICDTKWTVQYRPIASNGTAQAKHKQLKVVKFSNWVNALVYFLALYVLATVNFPSHFANSVILQGW